MSIPPARLIHTVTRVRPAVGTDSYGSTTYDYGDDADRVAMAAWLQQDQRSEPFADGRAPEKERWLMLTNSADVAAKDRVEWASTELGAVTFEVDGPPNTAYAGLAQTFHHLETSLRIITG